MAFYNKLLTAAGISNLQLNYQERLAIQFRASACSKGDAENRIAGEWMPDSSAYHCAYVFKWNHLIDKYNLTSNQTDLAKIADVESECRLN